jgi:superfamily I DNA/RNA helicase
VPDLILALNAGEELAREEGHGVTVTTMHSAKGREWENVFLCGVEEGIIPSVRADTDVAEERRLFYVAMTRASRRLWISSCEARQQSRGANMPAGPMQPREASRFIKEAGL